MTRIQEIHITIIHTSAESVTIVTNNAEIPLVDEEAGR